MLTRIFLLQNIFILKNIRHFFLGDTVHVKVCQTTKAPNFVKENVTTFIREGTGVIFCFILCFPT